MANYANLKATINANIKANGTEAITGPVLNSVLTAAVNTLGAGYQFMGVATTSTNPGTPDANVFYIAATPGTYTNFGGKTVADGEVAILKYNGTWTKEVTGAATAAQLTQLGQQVTPNSATKKEVSYTKSGAYANLSSATVGSAYTFAESSFANYAYWKIECEKGDVFVVTTKANSSGAKAYAILDSNGIVLDVHQATLTDARIEIPTGGVMLIVNSRIDSTYSVVNLIGRIALQSVVTEISEKATGLAVDIYNGSNGNVGNTNFVHSQVVKTYGAKYVTIQTTRANRNGCSYRFGYALTSNLSDIGRHDNYVNWSGKLVKVDASDSEKSAIIDLSDYPSTVGIAFTIGEIDTNGYWQALRETDFSSAQVINTFNKAVDGIIDLCFETRKELNDDVSALWAQNGIINLNNGSTGNPANADLVRSAVLPTNGAKTILIRITRPNSTGCHYGFGYALTSNSSDIGSTASYANWASKLYKLDPNSSHSEAFIDISDFPSAVGIAITIGEYDGSGSTHTIRTTDFDGYAVFVTGSPIPSAEKPENIVERNKGREIALSAICRYRKYSAQPQKDIEMLICTDSHNDQLSVDNAVVATNGFSLIDCFVHCGDIVGGYYNAEQISAFQNSISKLTKPGYIVVGNHDVGNAYYIGICCDHSQAYNAYIKPMVDKGWLAQGEYSANKPYWHHDLADYKIRLIGLYEYDDALDLNETYWRAITYNSGLSNIALNTAYSSGAQVNVPGYTDYSFEAVQAVTTPASYYTTPEKFPSYKVRRGQRVIRQEQAQWYLDTLLATPANYGVVVILHNPFADDAQVMDVKFSQIKSGVVGAAYSQNDMATDLIGGALAAFASGSNYSENVAMKGDAAYMNTQGGGTYAYAVSKNFASKNTGVKVFGLIGGHSHRDLVWGKGNFVQVTPICSTTDISNSSSGDIRRSDIDGLIKDSLTVISFAAQRIGLSKIGVDVTDSGYARDFEVIPVNN